VPLWTPCQASHQEGGRVAVVSDDVAEGVSDLGVTEFLGQVQAEQHGTIQVGCGLVLLRGRGADDLVGVVHVDIIGTREGRSRVRVDSSKKWHRPACECPPWCGSIVCVTERGNDYYQQLTESLSNRHPQTLGNTNPPSGSSQQPSETQGDH